MITTQEKALSVLGFRRGENPTEDEIRKAYKKMAMKTHPDKTPADATDAQKKAREERFKELNDAHKFLTDPDYRQEALKQAAPQQPTYRTADDIFNSIFKPNPFPHPSSNPFNDPFSNLFGVPPFTYQPKQSFKDPAFHFFTSKPQ